MSNVWLVCGFVRRETGGNDDDVQMTGRDPGRFDIVSRWSAIEPRLSSTYRYGSI